MLILTFKVIFANKIRVFNYKNPDMPSTIAYD